MKAKERVKAWRDRQVKEGNRIVTVSIPADCHEYLKNYRQITGESFGHIIGKSLRERMVA